MAFLPSAYGIRSATWTAVHAMKLHAAQQRGNRDAADLATLLPHYDVTSLAEAEALYEDYYPGDALTARTAQLVERILSIEPIRL